MYTRPMGVAEKMIMVRRMAVREREARKSPPSLWDLVFGSILPPRRSHFSLVKPMASVEGDDRLVDPV